MDGDIHNIDFKLSNEVITEMNLWWDLHAWNMVDYVYCPLPMIVAMHAPLPVLLVTSTRALQGSRTITAMLFFAIPMYPICRYPFMRLLWITCSGIS